MANDAVREVVRDSDAGAAPELRHDDHPPTVRATGWSATTNGSQGAEASSRFGRDELVDLAVKFAAPTSLVTALLFYFGWIRAQASLKIYGLHESLMDYSVTDMLLRSVSALYVPLGVLAAAGAGIAMLYVQAPVMLKTQPQRDNARNATHVALLCSVALVIYGSIALMEPSVVGMRRFITPLALLLGLSLAGTTVMVRRRTGLVAQQRPLPAVVVAGFAALVVLAAFYTVEDYARWIGQTRARDFIAVPTRLPEATLLSVDDLHIEAPTVEEEELGPTSRYRFRYTGLRLFTRTDAHYVFLHDDWDRATGTTILVPVDAVERLDLDND